MFLQIFVILWLVIRFVVEISKNLWEFSWEGESETSQVLSQSHIHTSIDSAELLDSFGSVCIYFSELFSKLFRIALNWSESFIFVECSIDLFGCPIGVETWTIESVQISLLFRFETVVVSDNKGTCNFETPLEKKSKQSHYLIYKLYCWLFNPSTQF